ncbi:extracellular solute-binding protein [Paenibacillus harenae]|uniref:Aldouronate transport system substrate-binding protein n=1 Tax=Paenibacillus harenae TaxID=306543 RepID=A0ABT9TXZ8_PAEHA|nr:extracellular solute-binding protein [Paenibacillus harenae]MDQ0112243.1 putative aldouronate transport system substrate-binding protein [Paenibacillus harenae]
MKKIRKRLFGGLSLILAGSLVLSACSGNSNNPGNEQTNSTGTQTPEVTGEALPAFGEQPLEFSYYMNYDWASPSGYGTNDAVTKWLKEEKKMNWTEIGSNGNAKQKFGTMVASDTLPDVIALDPNTPEFENLVKNKKIVPLDAYYDKYPNLKDLIDPDTMEMMRASDGHVYGMPSWFGSSRNENQMASFGWIVNRKIYAELGKPKLETFDDLYAYLKLVKDKYPDIIPMQDPSEMMIYGGYGDLRWSDSLKEVPVYVNFKTKAIESIFTDPAFKKMKEMTNKLYQEGLVSQDFLTQSGEQATEKLNSGRIAVQTANSITSIGRAANNILQAKDPAAGYDFIPYLYADGVDPAAVAPIGFGKLGWNQTVITTSAKEPERIFQFFDWWASAEGQRVSTYGPPGILWDTFDENGAPIDNEKSKTMTMEEKANLKLGWNPLGSWQFHKIGAARVKQNPEKAEWDVVASLFYGKFVKTNNDQFNGIMNIDSKSKLGIDFARMKQIVKDYDAKLVFARDQAEFDSVFKQYEDALNASGYMDLIAHETEVWKKNREKMGL